jgi:cell wall-associated NlpC family hydrolase
MTPARIVLAARSLLKTPYAAHQRTAGVGIDCAGVPIIVARMVGLKPPDFDVNNYALQPDGTLLKHCDEHMDRIPKREMRAGDCVIVSWGDDNARHFGIVADHPKYSGELSIIHATPKHGVVEHRLVPDRHMRIVAAYRFRGVQ